MKTTALIFRIVGFIIFALAGFFLGNEIISIINSEINTLPYAIGGAVILGVLGFILTPHITLYPIVKARAYLTKVSGPVLVSAMIGLIAGLIIAALATIPIMTLPDPLRSILPFAAAVLFGYLGVVIAVSRQGEFRDAIPFLKRAHKSGKDDDGDRWSHDKSILIDTSVIIDGRIVDIAKTGFLPGNLVIPRFVLNELQYIADSAENLRRQRGRRGMEVLAELQKDRSIKTTIADIDVEGVREVDEKLVMLGRQMNAPILTNDFNLNRVAELQGVHVLNINELANAVKSILLPGEGLHVRVIQEGKESGQGVGYLDDGTMVVVEDGHNYIGREIEVSVTKVLQTAAGRMIFSKPEVSNGQK
jgi:uncharacterized protein YacL